MNPFYLGALIGVVVGFFVGAIAVGLPLTKRLDEARAFSKNLNRRMKASAEDAAMRARKAGV